MTTRTDDPVSTIRTTVAVVPRVFAFLWEASPALLVGLTLILAFNAFAPAAMAWLSMKVIVNGVVDAATNATGWSPLAIPLGALFAVWVAQRRPDFPRRHHPAAAAGEDRGSRVRKTAEQGRS